MRNYQLILLDGCTIKRTSPVNNRHKCTESSFLRGASCSYGFSRFFNLTTSQDNSSNRRWFYLSISLSLFSFESVTPETHPRYRTMQAVYRRYIRAWKKHQRNYSAIRHKYLSLDFHELLKELRKCWKCQKKLVSDKLALNKFTLITRENFSMQFIYLYINILSIVTKKGGTNFNSAIFN